METVDLKGLEIPISISIKTQNKIEIFIIDSNFFNNDTTPAVGMGGTGSVADYNLDIALKEL